MSTLTRYTNDGHRFDIEGTMAVGYTINITVIPKEGYEFVQWLTNASKITEIDPDEDCHRKFETTIEECGYTISALFREEANNLNDNYTTLQVILGEEIDGRDCSEDIETDDIDETLDEILGNE